jgi:hypothetical protein
VTWHACVPSTSVLFYDELIVCDCVLAAASDKKKASVMFYNDVGRPHSTLVVTGPNQLTLVSNNTMGYKSPGPNCTYNYTVSGVCVALPLLAARGLKQTVPTPPHGSNACRDMSSAVAQYQWRVVGTG